MYSRVEECCLREAAAKYGTSFASWQKIVEDPQFAILHKRTPEALRMRYRRMYGPSAPKTIEDISHKRAKVNNLTAREASQRKSKPSKHLEEDADIIIDAPKNRSSPITSTDDGEGSEDYCVIPNRDEYLTTADQE